MIISIMANKCTNFESVLMASKCKCSGYLLCTICLVWGERGLVQGPMSQHDTLSAACSNTGGTSSRCMDCDNVPCHGIRASFSSAHMYRRLRIDSMLNIMHSVQTSRRCFLVRDRPSGRHHLAVTTTPFQLPLGDSRAVTSIKYQIPRFNSMPSDQDTPCAQHTKTGPNTRRVVKYPVDPQH